MNGGILDHQRGMRCNNQTSGIALEVTLLEDGVASLQEDDPFIAPLLNERDVLHEQITGFTAYQMIIRLVARHWKRQECKSVHALLVKSHRLCKRKIARFIKRAIQCTF